MQKLVEATRRDNGPFVPRVEILRGHYAFVVDCPIYDLDGNFKEMATIGGAMFLHKKTALALSKAEGLPITERHYATA
ncbi:MAG: hypothetical protein RIC93_01565 [Alphaproteobacteria bacterium]